MAAASSFSSHTMPRCAIGPTDPAGTAGALASGLRELGVDAELAVWSAHPFGFPADRVLSRAGRVVYALRAVATRDVIQLEYARSWLPQELDVRLARVAGRVVIARFHGDDCRLYGVARELFPPRGTTGDPASDDAVSARVARLARMCDAAVVADLELATYVLPSFRRVYVLPLPVRPLAAKTSRAPTPTRAIVVHAPSDPSFKGTSKIVAAVERAADRVDLDFRLLSGIPQREVAAALAGADVAIDQLDSVTPGVFAYEAMQAGLPVLCQLDRRALAPYQRDLPIIDVDEHSLERELVRVVHDAALRSELGRSGKEYVANVHAPARVAAAALQVYRHARAGPGGLYWAHDFGIDPLPDIEARIRATLATAGADVP